ncbi:Retrovirus-related Pol polyprotein from transposon 297 [Eumeta japonica]|uniref:RNA-directed DNA polymerase n=1 Tax=Eumeta variegata TaxID=151549 RepID=A0A4C2AEK7_EUMVA|nr:Retrovirus-related Pol polyprotein from transposon 297 [Eumeta japonica]
MAQPNQIQLDPVKYLNSIPQYNGNRNDLINFTRLIDRIYPVLRTYDELSQLVFSDIIKGRLVGRAKETIEINTQAQSWTDIKSILENNFGEKKNCEQLYDELRSTTFESTTVDFYNEIKYRLRRLNNKALLVLGEGEATNQVALNNQRSALHIFKNKMPEPMRTVLTCRNPGSLESAMDILFESGYDRMGKDGRIVKNSNSKGRRQSNEEQERNIEPSGSRINHNKKHNRFNDNSNYHRGNHNYQQGNQSYNNYRNQQRNMERYNQNYNQNQQRNYNSPQQPEPMEINNVQHFKPTTDSYQNDKESDLTFTNAIKHEIRTTNNIPIAAKTYRYPYIHKNEVKKQIEEMLHKRIIRPSHSPYSAPVWVVPKKLDANGFHQIEVHEKDIAKTAFSVEGGHYEFLRMPFGLKTAPATFQRLMNNVLGEFINKICLVYLDDIIIFSTSLQEHLESITKIFQRLKEVNLKIQLDKSEFMKKETKFLGHVVSEEGIRPNPDKIACVQQFPLPKTQKEIKQFLGLAGYYRKFMKDYSKIAKPMTRYLKKDSVVEFKNLEYIESFESLKRLLTNSPVLAYPDFNQKFVLQTDASKFALGAVLSQNGHPICYASRSLNGAEQNYSTIEKELLAIVWSTKYFRPYLFGRKFLIETDHRPLVWLFSIKEPNSKLLLYPYSVEEEQLCSKFRRNLKLTEGELRRHPTV